MKSIKKILNLAAVLAVTSQACYADGPNLLLNGSFEDGATLGGGFTDVDSWTRAGTQTGYIGAPPYTAQDGARLLIFSNANNVFDGSVTQNFTTVVGQNYTVRVDVGIVGLASKSQRLGVVVTGAGAPLVAQLVTITGPTKWLNDQTFTFTADSTTTNLLLSDQSAGISGTAKNDADLLIDKVSVGLTGSGNIAPIAFADSYSVDEDTPLNVLVGTGVLSNDTDTESDPLTAVQVTGPAHGSLTLNANGSFTYTPSANYNGADSFTYKANDGALDSNTVTVSLTVNPVADAPVAVADSYTATQNTPLVIAAAGVLSNDTDVDSVSLTAVKVADPANGAVTLNSDGGFTYTPTTGYTGADSFTYKANDGGLDSNTVTVSLTVNPPVSSPLLNGSFENGAVVSGSFTALDNWTVTGNPTGYVADSTYTAVDGARIALFNAGGNTFGGTVSQTISTIPGATYGVGFNFGIVGTAAKKQNLLVTVTGTGSLLSQAETLTAVAGPAQWSSRSYNFVADSTSATITFTDNSATLGGTLAQLCDLLLDNVTITPPVTRLLTVNSSTPGASITVSPADLFAAGNGVTGFTRTYNNGASVSLTAPGSFGGGGFLKWQKNSVDFTTNATAVVTMDGDHTLTAIFTVPGAPVANADSYSTNEDTPLVIATPGVLSNDTDPNSDPMTAAVESNPSNGTLSLNSNGGFTYTPSANFHGSDSFTYRASDGALTSSPATVSITVNPTNDAPSATAQSVSLNEDSTLPITLTGTDIDSDPLTFATVDEPLHGDLSGTSPNFTYTPDANYHGPDSFTFRANDGTVDSPTATISITVDPVADAPVAVAESYSTALNTQLIVNAPGVLGNDTDADSVSLTAVKVSDPTHGTLTFNSNGSFSYTPTTGYTGADSFTYKANDGALDSNVVTVSLTVAAPTNLVVNGSFETGAIVSGSVTALDNWTVTGNPIGYIADSTYTARDGVRLAVFNAGGNVFGGTISQVIPTVPGATYTLDFDFGIVGTSGKKQNLLVTAVGSSTLLTQAETLTAVAGAAQWSARNYSFVANSGTTTLTFTDNSATLSGTQAQSCDLLLEHVRLTGLSPSNLAPVANGDSYTATEGSTLTVPAAGVLTNDTDSESDPLTAIVVVAPDHGNLILNSNGGFSYTPDTGYVGADSFTYKANDGTSDSNVATVSITVEAALPTGIVNGSFELGALVAGSVTELDDWVVTGTPFGYIADSVYTSTDGLRIAAFNGGSNTFGGTISQTIATTPGESYDLDFNVGIVGLAGKKQRLLVTVTGTGSLLSQVEERTAVSGAAQWTSGSYTFVADSTSATITFTDHSGTLTAPAAASCDLLLDNVSVAPVPDNDAPVAVADSYSVTEGTILTIASPGVLGNDTDGDSDPLSAIQVAGPSHGSLTLNSNGGFTYTPTIGYVGADSFTYKANDGTADSNTVTVSFTVNAAPSNQLVNGSFESGSIISGSSTALDNWTVTGNPFGYIADSSYTSTDGLRIAVFNGGNNVFNGTITQSFTTVPGQAYNLNFDMGIIGTAGRKQRLQVTVTGADTLLSEVSERTAIAGPAQWLAAGYTFIADSTTTTITFADNSSSLLLTQASSCDLLLDRVRVTQISDARVLTVTTTPVSGLPVTITPADLGGRTDGVTSFTRSYITNSSVTLTATAASGANVFQKWQKNGIDFSTDLTVIVTMDANQTLNAVYIVDNSPRAYADAYSVNEDNPLVVFAPGVLGNDTDPNALSITAVLDAPPAHGALSLDPDGSFTYTPDSNFNGTDSFTYHANNGTLDSAVATVTLTVNPINDTPTAQPQSVETDEDVPLGITLVGTDPEGSALSYAVVDSPTHGSLTGTAPELTYTPAAGYHGPDSFTFTVNDGSGPSTAATVSINVLSVPDAPVANPQTLTLTAGTSIPVVLTATDSDGDPLNYAIATPPTNGTLSGTPPNLIYTPVANISDVVNFTDSFTFTAEDGVSTSAPATITLNIDGVLKNGSFEITTGTAPNLVPSFWTITRYNSTIPHYSVLQSPAGRIATEGVNLIAMNDVQRTPNAIFTQSFATTPGRPYKLKLDFGAYGASLATKLRVTLTGSGVIKTQDLTSGLGNVNTNWTAVNIDFTTNSATTTLELRDITASTTNVDLMLDNVRVIPQITRALTIDSTPDSGVLVTVTPNDIAGAANGTTGFSRLYDNNTVVNLSVPTTASAGTLNFQKWTKNGVDHAVTTATSVTMDAAYTMTAVYVPNAPPLTDADAYSTDEDVQLIVAAPGLLTNDSDPELLPITAAVDTQPANGEVVVNTNGSFTYTPDDDFNGDDTFTYVATDGIVTSEPTLVTITVNPVNDAPVANDDGSLELPAVTVAEDSGVSAPINVLGNDTDLESDPLTVTLATSPNGNVAINLDGTVTFEPAPDFSGATTISYTVNDGNIGGDATATVYIAVTNANDDPVFTADPITGTGATEDVAYTGSVGGSATDADAGDTLVYSKQSGPAWLNVASDGTLSGTPDNSNVGANSFTIRATDLAGAFDEAVLDIAVTNANDDPVFTADPITGTGATEDVAYTGTVGGSATDADAGDTLVYSKQSGPAWLTVAADGTLSGTPDNSNVGANSFTIRATDLAGAFDEAVLDIAVTNANDDPAFVSDPVNGPDAMEDTAYTGNLGTFASDVDPGETLSYSKQSGPAWLSIASDGTMSGTPANSDVGPNAFSVRVTDLAGAFDDAVLNITVVNANSAPVFTADPITGTGATEDVAYTGTVGGSATDADAGDTLVYSKQSGPAWLSVAADGTLSGTPDNSNVGANSFTIRATDLAGAFDEAVLDIAVTNANDDPVFTTDPITGTGATEDVAYTGSVGGSATDADAGDTLVYSKQSGPAWLSVAADGTLSGTPDNSNVGANSFTIRATDLAGAFDEAVLDIAVTNANDDPVFTADPITGTGATEDVAYTGTVGGSATDADAGDTLVYSKQSGPAWLNVAADGTLSGTPDNSNVGANSFTIRATDLAGAFDEAVLDIAVTNANDDPVFTADPITGTGATEDVAYTGSVGGSATDADAGDTLVYSKQSGPAWLNVAADGTLSGTPDNSNVGANSFTIRATDLAGAFDEAVLEIAVTNANDDPVFTADPITGTGATEDVAYTGSVGGSATDVDAGDTLVYSKQSGPAWLSVASDGTLSGTPDNSNVGANSFTIRATDLAGAFDEAVLDIAVNNANDDPVFTADPITGTGATEDVAYTGSVSGSATDVDAGDTLVYSKQSGPAWLSVAADGTLSGTPDNSNVGANSFTIRATDLAGAFDEAVLDIAVTNANDDPVFTADPITGTGATEDVAYTGTVGGSATDADAGDTLVYSKQSGPAWLSVAADGTLSGTPDNSNVGANSFTIRATDLAGAFDEAVLEIAVTNANDDPVFTADPITGTGATEDVAYTGSVGGSATDVDAGDTLVYSKQSGPAWLNVGADGTLSGTPDNSNVGANSFTIRATDLAGAFDEAVLDIAVTNANDDPVFTADPITGTGATEDLAYAGTVGGSATDADAGDTLVYSKQSGPAWLNVAADGTLSGTPDNSNVGANSFTIRATDLAGAFDEAVLNIAVTNANDDPVFTADPITGTGATEDVAYTGTVGGSATDADAGDALVYSKQSGPAWLSVAADGTLSGTPDNSNVGANSFTIRATDLAGAFDEAVLDIAVTNANDDPVFTADPITGTGATEDVAYTGNVGGSATDADAGDTLVYSKQSGPAWLSVAADGTLSGTPDNSNVGANSFTIRATDLAGAFDEAVLDIAVTNANDDPVFTADPITGTGATEDVAYTGSVGGSATDVDAGDTLVYSKQSGPAWLSVAADGTLSGTPDNSNVGANSFTIRATDLAGAFDEAVLDIAVTNANDDPVFTADPITGTGATEDVAYTGTVGGSATDADAGDTLVYSKQSGPAWLSVAADGTLSGTPDNSNVGANSFTIRATDLAGAFDEATLNIEVTGSTYLGFEAWLAEFSIPGSTPTADPDNDTISNAIEYVIGGNPANRANNGLLPTRTFVTADPDNNSVSSDYLLFTYRRTDRSNNDPLVTMGVQWSTNAIIWNNATGTPDVVTLEDNDFFDVGIDRVRVYLPRTLGSFLLTRLAVDIDYSASNLPPTANAQSVNVNEDASVVVTLTGTDPEAAALTYAIVTPPAHGALSGTGASRTYTPTANYHGADSFTFTVSDGTNTSAPATVTITVNSLEEINQWLTSYGISAGPQVDSDGDSISNAMEWVIGGNPATQPDTALLPVASLVTADLDNNTIPENYLLFTYRRSDLAKDDPSTIIKVEWDTDLTGLWTNATGTPGVTTVVENDAFGAGVDRVKVYIPRSFASNGKLFARLGVVVNTP